MKVNKVKVVSKGYTIRVLSWENDGDYYATNSMTVQTIEEAKAWYELMMFCKPFGNAIGFKKLYKNIEEIIEFMKTHNQLFDTETIEEYKEDDEYNKDIIDYFCYVARTLLGSSDFYYMRVMESCVVTYSPKDIYVETVKFNN